ncbi:MAG: pyridoxamine 5'-phosphate oxidase family protein [Raoultibacter sp.]
MERPMRRKKQEIDEAGLAVILATSTSGVLGVNGIDGFPYTVPLSFAHEGNALYFHCATQGYKLDALAADNRASFTIIAADEIVPAKFTTKFRSIITQGRTHFIENAPEKQHALELLVAKYSPGFEEAGAKTIAKEWGQTQIIRFDIENICGKEGREFVKLRPTPPR